MSIDYGVIESKTITLSVLRYPDNTVHEQRQSETKAGGNVSLIEGAAGGWFVADNGATMADHYYLYCFEEEDEAAARSCYAKCVEQIADNEAIERGDS
jgi:hypothetical protein